MSQRYYQPLRPRPDAPSSSYNQPSHERLAPTSLPFPASSSSGLGLSFYTASMAMTQTQSSRPVHGLSYFQRPMWDPTSTLMLNASSDSADMDRGKSWEEAYDPFAQFHTTDPPTHDQPLLLTPVSRSAGYQRLSETPNPIPSHGFPHSQAGSYSSVSYPSSEAYHLERSTSLFSHSSVKVEDPLDWTSNPHNELQVPRTSMENEFFVTPESVYDSHRFVQSPAPTELHALSHVAPKLGKHHRDDSLAERGSPRLSVQRLKQAQSKRRRTPRENANWVCEICDMPFERSYNLKSHMDTHDPDRQKPFKCEYEGCYREFVRKTDLMRHISSVRLSTCSNSLY